jgi:metal-responsive CopG/Arc/MetJ family transcriptional regulator
MSKSQYSERFTIGCTPDQIRRLDELVRVRSRQGQKTNRAELVRDAVNFYLLHQEDLPGSRKAIARSVEGKIAQVDRKVDHLTDILEDFIERVTQRKGS